MKCKDRNKLHVLSWSAGVELYEANFQTQCFSRHAHDAFAIGAITAGTGGYRCRGADHVLPRRSLSLMNPNEVHTGHCVDGNLQYKMLYVNEAAVRGILGVREIRGFRELTPLDQGLSASRDLVRLADDLQQAGDSAWRLRIDLRLTGLLERIFASHGGLSPIKAANEPRAVRKVKDYLQSRACAGGAISLQQLAALVDLHPNYLVHVFSRALGISPYAYVMQCKALRAKERILRGERPLTVALDLGYFDQSHFIRHFKKVFGVTPGNLVRH